MMSASKAGRTGRSRNPVGPVDHYRLGGAEVRVEWGDEFSRAALGPALAHRIVESTGPAALRLTVQSGTEWSEGGEGKIELEGEVGFSLRDPARRMALRLGGDGRTGGLICDAGALPVFERAAPFRLLFQRWLPTRGVRLLHAGAVGLPAEGAVLLVARSGGGKSNTTLACLGSALQLLGEDFVGVDDRAEPSVWSIYSTAKLHAKDLPRFPGLAADAWETRDDLDGKAALALSHRHAARFAERLPLRAILVLHVGGESATRITPGESGEAAREMLASVLMALPEERRPLFEFITRLVRRVPVHRLELGEDRSGIPAAIGSFLSQFR